MASTAATAARRAQAIDRLRTAADTAQARAGLAIGEPATTKDAEIDRIQWIEYAASVLDALNAAEPAPAASTSTSADEPPAKRKR